MICCLRSVDCLLIVLCCAHSFVLLCVVVLMFAYLVVVMFPVVCGLWLLCFKVAPGVLGSVAVF